MTIPMEILKLSKTDFLFYGGIALMAIAVVFALIFIIVFILMGQKLKDRLRQEYGEPWRYNM